MVTSPLIELTAITPASASLLFENVYISVANLPYLSIVKFERNGRFLNGHNTRSFANAVNNV